jgi:hypothetical protein
MDVRPATALVGGIEYAAEFCRRQQISRVTFIQVAGGVRRAGCGRAGRTVAAPAAVAAVLACRVELVGAGLDHGPQSAVAIAGSIDDHSRYVVGSSAGAGAGTTALVWAVTLAGIALAACLEI